MMSIITQKKYENGMSENFEYVWHVGEPLPDLNVQGVLVVQADGDELEFIYREFANIPHGRGSVVMWFGDMAKFIAGNL